MDNYLVEVQFDYGSNKNILTRGQLDLLQSISSREVRADQLSKRHLDINQTSFWRDEDKNHEDARVMVDAFHIGGKTNIVSLKNLLDLDIPIEFKILNKIKEIPEYNVQETIFHKLIKLESKLNQFDQQMQFNYKVGVHISDLGLLNVKQVTWLEDACTEQLQKMLDRGWRILAVCPQPNSRRPDYVLGKNDKCEDEKEGILAGRSCS
jgi:hypothetical protein